MEGRAQSSNPPPSIPSTCAACNKPVDALRAAQVAIIDGAFRYFCDLACKGAYVEAVSKRPALEAMTADPPAVSAARSTDVRPVIASGVREQIAEEASRDAATEPSEPSQSGEPAVAFPAVSQVTPRMEVAEPASEPTPHTLRSPLATAATKPEGATVADQPARSEARPDAPRSGQAAGLRPELGSFASPAASVPIAGVVAGVLAGVVSLAGEPAGALALPLALVAAAIAVGRVVLGARESGESPAWVIGAPIAFASVVATVSTLLHHPHAESHGTFVGLAAASALAVDILLSRVRRDVVQVRVRTAQALDVGARVVQGKGSNSADEVSIVDASQVKPGEQVVVDAGETIAVDGIVAAGEAEVAPWLDSPSLVKKKEGDAVVAGATVVSGRLRVNTTFAAGERAWLRLAQPTPSRIEIAAPLVAFMRRAVTRAAPVAAVVVAGAVYADNGSWLDVALAACAAGYALAASAAVSAAALAHARGHVAAQRRGIVYKDAAAFDAAARADVAVVCSRGTILLGEPEIVAVETVGSRERESGEDPSRVLALAAGAEMSSTHPFASAILREARARSVRPDNVRSALGHSGLGVTALASNGDRVIVGSRAFLLQEKVSVAIADARTSELEAQGRSVLLVAASGRLVGLLALQDGLRPGARAAVQRMHDTRIEPVLLSGEARDTCETIARALDIEHVRPEILPADRGAEVRALSDGGRVVAALGHALTDDGALGAADVSVAMEAAGAAPGEWSVALASDDVRDAALALTVPRAARDRARVAIVVGALTQAASALGIAIGVAPLAIGPVLGVLAAAAAVAVVREPSP